MRTFSAVFSLILISAAAALADTIVFNTFGPGQSINKGYETVSSLPFTVGMKFTPSFSVELTKLTAPWAVMNGADPASNTSLAVALFNDVGGQPGSPLESWSVLVTPPFNCPGSPLTNSSPYHCVESTYTLDSALSPDLFADQPYWLLLQGEPRHAIYWGRNLNTGTEGFWNGGSALGQGPYFKVFPNSPALQVSGVPIPEPASFVLLAAGLMAASVAARTRMT